MIGISKKLEQIAKTVRHASKNKKDLESLLSDILSPAEIEDISDRLNIFRELLNDSTQREVSAKLKVSIAKVTRAAHVIKYGSGALAKIL